MKNNIMNMKKYLKYITLMLLIAGFTSCAKEDVGGTAVQDMAGEWYVVIDGVDEDGNVLYPDFYDEGTVAIYTYNTVNNDGNVMWLNLNNFWGASVIVNINYGAKTFSALNAYMYDEEDDDGEIYPVNVDITNGVIVPNGATSPAGYTADSISFYALFEDDGYAGIYYDRLWFHGYRRTGLLGGYD